MRYQSIGSKAVLVGGLALRRRGMNTNQGINLKKIFEHAGWTEAYPKVRRKKGTFKQLYTKQGRPYRFCDLASSHMMRKTAITTMLLLGMPEPLVRKVSGHAPNSKEFYRYVKYSQSFLDEHTDTVFDKLASSGK